MALCYRKCPKTRRNCTMDLHVQWVSMLRSRRWSRQLSRQCFSTLCILPQWFHYGDSHMTWHRLSTLPLCTWLDSTTDIKFSWYGIVLLWEPSLIVLWSRLSKDGFSTRSGCPTRYYLLLKWRLFIYLSDWQTRIWQYARAQGHLTFLWYNVCSVRLSKGHQHRDLRNSVVTHSWTSYSPSLYWPLWFPSLLSTMDRMTDTRQLLTTL